MHSLPAPDRIEQIIQALERRHLDNASALAAPIWGEIENLPLLRVLGLSAFWKAQQTYTLEQCMDDLVSSAYGQNLSLYFLVISQGHRSGLYFGAQSPGKQDSKEVLFTLLSASFPGINLEELPDQSFGRTLNAAGFFTKNGRITGVPTRKTYAYRADGHQDGHQSISGALQIDRLLRGMRGETWGYFIKASPLEYRKILHSAILIVKDIEATATLTKHQVQEVRQTLQQVDPTTQTGETRSV